MDQNPILLDVYVAEIPFCSRSMEWGEPKDPAPLYSTHFYINYVWRVSHTFNSQTCP